MNARPVSYLLVVLLVGVCAAGPDQQGEQQLDLGAIVTAMGSSMPKPSASGSKLPDFEEVTKDMESKEGLFTLWYYPEKVKDKDPEKLLCQIPAAFLGQKFMLSTSFAGGGFFTGFPLDERVVQWELLGNQLLLVEPETAFAIKESDEVSDVVRRTYPDGIRAAVPVVTRTAQGDPVIDLGGLLKSDFADITWMSFFEQGMQGLGQINSSLSKWTRKKSFPLNVEIGVELAVSQMSPPGSYNKKLVHYSFWKLPKSDYQPRVADDRVGYFLTTHQDWSKPTDARDLFNRYVDRWHLVKRDPSLPLCEPKQPIIFYIEKTVPVRFRRAVRDGILEWNKAYEKIGFSNAVQVRQQTEDNEWKDLDPEDMRYSFFRWIVTGAGFAMGPHRANPFTGQIYDADIIFDDSMVRYFEQSADMLLPSDAMVLKMKDPALRTFLEHYPQWRRQPRGESVFSFGQRQQAALRDAMLQRMRTRGRHACDYMHGMRQQMAVARAVLAGERKEVKDKFLYDVIKEVVMHEVGHTLGLRHNFKASSIYSLDEIKQRRKTDQPTVGSVMDYNPALFSPEAEFEGHFITPTIGPYDQWAIEYGYRPSDGTYKPDKDKVGQDEGNEAEAEQADSPSPSGNVEIEQAIQQVPQEVLDQLPDEVRKMLQSGQAAGFIAQQADIIPGAAAGGSASTPPSFKAPPSGEEKMLSEIASRASEPELAYATDEDTTFFGVDPLSNRFDMSGNPVAWAKDRIKLVDQRIADILEWGVEEDESWYHVRNTFLSLLVEKAFILDYVGRFIGGQYFHRSHRGDPDAPSPFVLVEPQRQRAALKFIEDTLFTDEFFSVDPEVLNHLAPSRWWHQGTSVSFTMDFPIHDYIAVLQWWNLFDRLLPNTLRRIHDAEMKSNGSDKFTVAEYIQRVQKGVWQDACDAKRARTRSWSDAAPFVSDVRRSLQREYLGLVEPLVRYKPGDVLSPDLHAMMKYSLAKLLTQIDEVLATGHLDFASEAHLTSCKSRIERMLAPELNEYQAQPPLVISG